MREVEGEERELRSMELEVIFVSFSNISLLLSLSYHLSLTIMLDVFWENLIFDIWTKDNTVQYCNNKKI